VPCRHPGRHPAPGARIRYGVQGAIDPPTFTLFAPATSSHLPALHRAWAPRALRPRATPIKMRVRTAAVAEERSCPGVTTATGWSTTRLTEEGTCPVCDTQLVEPERATSLDVQAHDRGHGHLPRLAQLPGHHMGRAPRLTAAAGLGWPRAASPNVSAWPFISSTTSRQRSTRLRSPPRRSGDR